MSPLGLPWLIVSGLCCVDCKGSVRDERASRVMLLISCCVDDVAWSGISMAYVVWKFGCSHKMS